MGLSLVCAQLRRPIPLGVPKEEGSFPCKCLMEDAHSLGHSEGRRVIPLCMSTEEWSFF